MQSSTSNSSASSRRLLRIFYAVLALIPWLIVIAASPRSFDLTDEAFYLLSTTHPEDITATFSMFGIVLNPLYDLVGWNIIALRVVSVLIWLGVSTGVAWLTLGFIPRKPAADSTQAFAAHRRILLMLLLSAASVLYYSLWLITPSYNWLALVGLTAFWGGFLLWLNSAQRTWRARIGVGIFACAAALVFWAKPTSAALAAFFPLLALILERRQWRRLLDPQSLIAGVIGFALGISMPLWNSLSPQRIITTMIQGIEHQNYMKPGEYNSVFGTISQGIDELRELFSQNLYPSQYLLVWLIPLIVGFLIARSALQKELRARWVRLILSLGLAVNLIMVSAVLSENIGHWSLNVVLITVAYLLMGHYTEGKLTTIRIIRKQWQSASWLIPIFSLIFVFIFGSSNNYVFQSAMAAYFYLFGTAVLFLTVKEGTVNAVLMQVAVPTLLASIIWLIYVSSLTPYRQDVPVWNMNQAISVDGEANTLLVSDEMARYIGELRALAESADFQPGTPLIDLTGRSPGASYVLQARPYGFPWLLGAYPGSDSSAIYILKQWSPEQLRSAWILTAVEGGMRSLSLSVLAEVGLDFPADYVQVGTTRLPASSEIDALWQPTETADSSR